MDVLIFLLIIFLAFILILGIPIVVSYLIYRVIKKRNFDKRLRIIALTPIVILGYLIYISIFPGEDFYKADFKEVTGTELPKNAEINYKRASFPDHFGDYTSVSIINVGQEFYDDLPKQLLNQGLSENQARLHASEFDKALKHTDNLKINKEFSMEEDGGVYYYVGFLSDGKTIIVKRLSW